MAYDHITTDGALAAFCEQLGAAKTIAFDTEFVSEHSYRPVLCLVQVASAGRLAVIDSLAVRDMTPLWRLVAAPGHETIVHAGREELLFCQEAVGASPALLHDVQLAAGLVGYEYPAGYGSLLAKLLGERPKKGETRTDWRRRPLSPQQIDYALDDVRHLEALWSRLAEKLASLGRMSWLDDEMAAWQRDVEHSRGTHRWRRVSGITGLSRRSMAIARELWLWRESEAGRRDCPTRHVLRDDLIVELAKRQSADPNLIRAVRGMERGDLQRAMPHIAAAIGRALAVEDKELPTMESRDVPARLNVLGQFVSSALGGICRKAHLAPSLVGTASDVRDLVAHRLGYPMPDGSVPLLGRGWRAEIVGRLIDDLLAGKVAIRIGDPLADEPLVFEPLSG